MIVEHHLSELGSCSAGGVHGKLSIQVTIGPDGKVTGVSITSNELKSGDG